MITHRMLSPLSLSYVFGRDSIVNLVFFYLPKELVAYSWSSVTEAIDEESQACLGCDAWLHSHVTSLWFAFQSNKIPSVDGQMEFFAQCSF